MSKDFHIFWSVILPGMMLACSILLTGLLYRHFVRKQK